MQIYTNPEEIPFNFKFALNISFSDYDDYQFIPFESLYDLQKYVIENHYDKLYLADEYTLEKTTKWNEFYGREECWEYCFHDGYEKEDFETNEQNMTGYVNRYALKIHSMFTDEEKIKESYSNFIKGVNEKWLIDLVKEKEKLEQQLDEINKKILEISED